MEHVVLATMNLVRKYDLSWDKSEIITHDNALIDKVFEAGLELAESSGVYCINTGRIIQFAKDDLLHGLANAPQQLQMGEGAEACTLYARQVMDARLPLICAGNPGAPTPEEIFIPYTESCMQEPIVDMATCGSITHIDGQAVESGSPMEIYAAQWECRTLREIFRRVGKPGMGLLAGQSAVLAPSSMAWV